MTTCIDKFDDIIDSRDVIARIEELREERNSLVAARDEARDAVDADVDTGSDSDRIYAAALRDVFDEASEALDAWDASEEADELRILVALASEAEGCGDWEHGETLIRESTSKTTRRNWPKNATWYPTTSHGPATVSTGRKQRASFATITPRSSLTISRI